jgi:hypothetical protein
MTPEREPSKFRPQSIGEKFISLLPANPPRFPSLKGWGVSTTRRLAPNNRALAATRPHKTLSENTEMCYQERAESPARIQAREAEKQDSKLSRPQAVDFTRFGRIKVGDRRKWRL